MQPIVSTFLALYRLLGKRQSIHWKEKLEVTFVKFFFDAKILFCKKLVGALVLWLWNTSCEFKFRCHTILDKHDHGALTCYFSIDIQISRLIIDPACLATQPIYFTDCPPQRSQLHLERECCKISRKCTGTASAATPPMNCHVVCDQIH